MQLHAIHVVVKRRSPTQNRTVRAFVFSMNHDDGVLKHTKTTATGSEQMLSMVPNRRAAMLETAAKALRGWVDMIGRDYEIVSPIPQESDAAIAYDL